MYEKTRAIVLHVMKYSDKNSIARVYSDTRGRMSLLLPQGVTRAARARNAMFMPLSMVECEVGIVAGRELYSFKDCRCVVLSRCIQESERNKPLFDYIAASVRLLDSMDRGVANFHICFLYHLGAFLGIQPDTATYRTGYWFDMENGIFTQSHPAHSHVLAPREAAVMMLLARMTFANLHHFRFNHVQRNEILDIALDYYKLHNSTLGSMRSPDILRQVFE